jgi:uncharacterized protein DUF3300
MDGRKLAPGGIECPFGPTCMDAIGLSRRIGACCTAMRPVAASFGLSVAAALVSLVLLGARVQAQGAAAVSPVPALYSSAQLDQMLAPIALYPDDVLGQVLMAASYPLEVVQADRWLQEPANAALHGEALAQALQSQPWDASVKSLVAFPQVLAVMDNNLEWTEELGEAFLAQQADVMDRIQQLRSRAMAARTLTSSPQQTVVNDGPDVEIAPSGPDSIYVPVYDPNLAYGDWPYPDYLPYYFDVPGYAMGGFMTFAIVAPLWGWNHWDWGHHQLNIGGGAGPAPGVTRLPFHPGPWRHEPGHRGGVPFRHGLTQAQFGSAAGPPVIHGSFRGYPPSASAPAPAELRTLRQNTAAPQVHAPAPEPRMPMAEPLQFPHAAAEHPSPPAMESFGNGAQVRAQEQRGASSRMSTPSRGGGVHR